MELDPGYCDVIIERWQTSTGSDATLDGNGQTFDDVAHQRRVRAA